uniref:Transmembrane protein n=1 Tax=Nelumbo nucifera TaxID=4432 RepID=A0A822XTE7_NELNU|nr:TPA_asm: hypothetical protein HUJ06_025133 [Nelumbo nucifera]
MVHYKWSVGSIVAMVIVAAFLLLLPLAMSPGMPQPPPLTVFSVFPVLMAALLIYLSQASK